MGRLLVKQMVRWVDCQLNRWLDGQIVSKIDDKMGRSLVKQMVRWLDEQFFMLDRGLEIFESSKYPRFTPLGCKELDIIKFKFMDDW